MTVSKDTCNIFHRLQMLLTKLNNLKIIIDPTRFYVLIALGAYLPVSFLYKRIKLEIRSKNEMGRRENIYKALTT